MKGKYALFCLAFSITVLLQAQQDASIRPMSWNYALGQDDVPAVNATPFDAQAAYEKDLLREAEGKVPLYGRMCTVGASLFSHGAWTVLPNGDRIWRLKVISPGALATDLFFEDFHLPPGAYMHVYDPQRTQVHGAFLDKHVQSHGYFTTDMIFGESCVIEYYEPLLVKGEGHFTITQVSHAYRMVGASSAADTCEVDVNCSEGEGWQAQRDAVVRIRVVDPEGTGYCTGVLMNNTAQDCRPYILTAMHCAEESTVAHFNQFVFRFGYQRAGCDSGQLLQGANMNGCVKRADSNDGGGNQGSDFLLLELNDPLTADLVPYFAGWDVTNAPSPSGKGIHHPAGSMKKISTYTSATQSTSWGSASGSHWRVRWVQTENGRGVTEGGSSGSPLFDPQRRVVGTLTGGASCCAINGCGPSTGPNAWDYYGKISHHFFGNPNGPGQKLRDWLDPNGGTNVFDGAYNPCGTLITVNEVRNDQRPEIHPNPNAGEFTVNYPNGVARADRIEVSDLSGRVVHVATPRTMGKAQIDGSGWSAGTYLVSVIANGVRYAGAKVTVEGR